MDVDRAMYDHYFEMTSAYFGVESSCEPVHILWDADDDTIKAANNLRVAHRTNRSGDSTGVVFPKLVE
jgi:hypothetical protein